MVSFGPNSFRFSPRCSLQYRRMVGYRRGVARGRYKKVKESAKMEMEAEWVGRVGVNVGQFVWHSFVARSSGTLLRPSFYGTFVWRSFMVSLVSHLSSFLTHLSGTFIKKNLVWQFYGTHTWHFYDTLVWHIWSALFCSYFMVHLYGFLW